MRRSLIRMFILATVILGSSIALTGCMGKTGDLGNKNIRPNAVRGEGMTKMRFASDQDNAKNRMYGERRENNNVVGMHDNSHLQLSDKVAAKISSMPGISSAYVILTEHNAYVAVKEKGKTQLGAKSVESGMKDKIANRIKSLSPSVQHVYVSANPDFTKRMEGYANDVKKGHSLQGFISEFNALVERVFPASSGTHHR
ncbi:YhcN/YlaJ family sporulation lipoprotein [Cohnella endophytica]|uniref:YhcN/YlaJ family sporulation lipoprotein n=1 Tax=Cohnella endophytica TaxID=2419778 RepID=A0A494Y3T2_9BACL|nr:YhcN/YlaJ family sporulation lipoprotein [Cohnella endophytica]RKP54946.1 YhcN/YlaJ family sporulation lipoprotein [Cohnella endophytica]